MAGFLSRIFGESFFYEEENEEVKSENNNLNSYRFGAINVEYIRGVSQLDDYEWFIKIILDKVKANTLVFVDLKSIKCEQERFIIKSLIRETIICTNGSFRNLRKDQNLCLLASSDISTIMEDVSLDTLSCDKKIKIIRNITLDEDLNSIFATILDAYSTGSTLIVDLSDKEDSNERRDIFNCMLGATLVLKGAYRSVGYEKSVFVFAPCNAITTFDNFG